MFPSYTDLDLLINLHLLLILPYLLMRVRARESHSNTFSFSTFAFLKSLFTKVIFLSNLYTQCEARTHDPSSRVACSSD